MSYKVTKANEAYTYHPDAHYDCRCTRLHDPQDVNEGELIIGLSHFLPGGGCEFGSNGLEFVYYIVEGQMTITVEGKTYELKKGDSIHCGPNTEKEIKNNGITTTQMLVILLPKKN